MLDDLKEEIIKFRDQRNWKQFHNPKDLSISISIEASELLENFQWKSSEEAVALKVKDIQEELADVLIYSILLADAMDFDINEIIRKKLEKNNMKYPAEKAFGKKEKYTEL